MPAAMPTEQEIQDQTRRIITEAYDSNTINQLTKRLVREHLQQHFGVDLEEHKKFISRTVQVQVNEVGSTSIASSSAKNRSADTGSCEFGPSAKGKASVKHVDASNDDGEAQYGTGAHSEADEPDFSELEDEADRISKPVRASDPSKSTKKARSSNGSSSGKSRPSTNKSRSGQTEAEQRLTRLKSLVVACGVRKPWKKLYENAGIGLDDFQAQCRIVQGVLNDLGMTGRGSLEQAKKIRDKREFADELSALQENEIDATSGRGGRRGRGQPAAIRTTINVNEHDTSDEGDAGSDSDDTGPKRRRENRDSTSSQSDSDSEDAPPKRKTFKSSLASFAAGLNSDSD